MIASISIKNYRCFKKLELSFNPNVNILVGGNEAGKSTILEAITLAMTGRVGGRWAQEELNPYWFNSEITKNFFVDYVRDQSTPVPEIEIEIVLESQNPVLIQQLKGTNNSSRKDLIGMRVLVSLDPVYAQEFVEYMGNDEAPALLPTDYFQVSWTSFRAPDQLRRKPRGLFLAQVDERTLANSRGVDYYTRQLILEHIDPSNRAKLSTAMRVTRERLGREHLKQINDRLSKEAGAPHRLGVHLDQTAGSSWEAAVAPQVDEIPFGMSGQAQQAFVKIELALLKNEQDEGVVLVEEPENHLSHTRLRQLVARMQSLAGGRQLILSTHSSYVLNRLGLDALRLVGGGKAAPFENMEADDIEYFKKLPNFDTLRLILADKVLLVEGPSEQLVVEAVCEKYFQKSTAELGIDVISIAGTPFKRWFSLAKLLERPVVGIRDNDGQPAQHWRKKYELTDDSLLELYVGDPVDGHTLEPQIVKANSENHPLLREILAVEPEVNLEEWMKNNKTEAALAIAVSERNVVFPSYFVDAVIAANGKI